MRFIYWLLSEQPPSLPAEEFLSPRELETFAGLRFEKRRAEWLHGRFAAHLLLHQQYPQCGYAQFEVLNQPSGAPSVFLNASPLPLTLSISHRQHAAFCALCLVPRISIGADLEFNEPRSAAFVHDFFTADEVTQIETSPPEHRRRLANLIWSAKESALKALRLGLRLDTRQVHISGISPDFSNPAQWQPFTIHTPIQPALHWQGWWQTRRDYLLTLAACCPSSDPVILTPLESVPALR